MQMNAEIKAQWLTALRGGEYTQGRNYLRNCDGEFCCLGVLSDLAVKGDESFSWNQEYEGDAYYVKHESDMLNRHYLPEVVADWAGLDETFSGQGIIETRHYNRHGKPLRISLSGLNDSGLTFEQIADVIDYFL